MRKIREKSVEIRENSSTVKIYGNARKSREILENPRQSMQIQWGTEAITRKT